MQAESPDGWGNLEHARSQVEVTDYSLEWPLLYEREREHLKVAMRGVVEEFHHIGSTAVPGMPSKPCLDILAIAPDLDLVNGCLDRLGELGYQSKGVSADRPHHWFLRRLEQGRRKVHLHVVRQGHQEASDYVLFRDYLREVAQAAATYASYKRELTDRSRDREEYVTTKERFVDSMMLDARAWAADRR